ncbi:MAG: hypothetical protein U0835_02860 [Isosphaeraceae bacterium]
MTPARVTFQTALTCLALATALSPFPFGRAQEVPIKDARLNPEETFSGPLRPLSSRAARTWIALHEAKIRPLPDGTPLRQVLRAVREATRGQAGWSEGIEFRVVSEALLEAEVTLDAPVVLPFVGRPEVSVDMYLKYLLRQFVWERYVGEGTVIIDSPCDDCVGYTTVGVAEAHAWLLFHGTAPRGLPERATLEELLTMVVEATRGKGLGGRGIMIHPEMSALRAKGVTLRTPVSIKSRESEIGGLLQSSLNPLGLALRVLPDGSVMLTENVRGGSTVAPGNAFPEYRFSYEYLWKEWVEARREAAQTRQDHKSSDKSPR